MKAAARDALPGRREPNSMEIEIVGASRSMQKNIKVAIAGVGNCASALVQGVEYYRDRQGAGIEGVMRHSIGGYNWKKSSLLQRLILTGARSVTLWKRRSFRKAELHSHLSERLTRVECHRPSWSCA